MRHFLVVSAFLACAPAMGALAQQASAPPSAPPTGDAQATSQQAAADLPPGQRMFNVCRACHTFNEGERALIGPNLYGIFGRRAGSIEGYRYSVNMKRLGESGHVWSEESLRRWLTDPQAMVPRTAMKFPGVPNEAILNELLPLLKQATSEGP